MDSNLMKGQAREWGLQSFFVGLVGAALLYTGLYNKPELNVVLETIILVLFLGPLLGIAPLPFPNLAKLKFLYPIVGGLISALMDSFLVLMMIAAIPVLGALKHQLKFKAYNTVAALIGGLLIYFGEVYALPHYLKYGVQNFTGAFFLFPPIAIFLSIIGILIERLEIEIQPKEVLGGVSSEQNMKRRWENTAEFAVGIALLLITHNPVLCLGILMIWTFVSGQGNDFVAVLRHETEMEVLLLLIFAALVFEPLQPFTAQLTDSYMFFVVSTLNAVLGGALLPAAGNMPLEIILISAGALVTPISSLVGVMLFKTWKEWVAYMKVSIPLTILWLILGLVWVLYLMPESWVQTTEMVTH